MPEFLLLVGQNKKQKRLKCKRPVSKGQSGKKPSVYAETREQKRRRQGRARTVGLGGWGDRTAQREGGDEQGTRVKRWRRQTGQGQQRAGRVPRGWRSLPELNVSPAIPRSVSGNQQGTHPDATTPSFCSRSHSQVLPSSKPRDSPVRPVYSGLSHGTRRQAPRGQELWLSVHWWIPSAKNCRGCSVAQLCLTLRPRARVCRASVLHCLLEFSQSHGRGVSEAI